MPSSLPPALQDLADALSSLPSIGRKNAMRLALHLFSETRETGSSLNDATQLRATLKVVEDSLRYCERCFHVSESELCTLCQDSRRDSRLLCIVEQPLDIFAIEQSGQYRGFYFVLGGVLAPVDGVGPRDIRLPELQERVANEDISEVILATNPSMEGEATASYIAKLLNPHVETISRLARGLPTGGSLEYADDRTLGSAFEGRKKL